MKTYEEFLESKISLTSSRGILVDSNSINSTLFHFQRYCVVRALEMGRFAFFEDCGLGKTIQQLVWADEIVKATACPVVILAPLSVVDQTIEESRKFGVVGVVRWMPEMAQNVADLPDLIYVAHYEQLGSLPTEEFAGVVLDESSILKNEEGKTRNALLDAFADTPYKLCCTATPSPNDPMELGNHAEFLGVMTRQQMLAMYFVHDGGDTDKWRIKPHAQKLFWRWVATWAVMLSKPADIGFPMEGYDLPPLNPVERTIQTPKRDNGQLFNDVAVSATSYNQELRITKAERLTEVASLVNDSIEPFIIWVSQDEEADAVCKLVPDAVEVRGSMTPEMKSKRLLGFARGEFRVLLTKPKICAFGLNYQHCANQVFAAPDFSFEKVYQAIRRSYRFGQTRPVNIYMIVTDTMQSVAKRFEQKQRAHAAMQASMTAAVNEHQLQSKSPQLVRQPLQRPEWLQSLCTSSINS